MDLMGECTALVERGYKCNMIGRRRTDPRSEDLTALAPQGPGYPTYTRSFPVIEWKYNLVWEYLRTFDVTYCCLYDQGYTSLGEIHNSCPNPALKNEDGTFKPAW